MSSQPNSRLASILAAALLCLLSTGRAARGYELRLWPLLDVTSEAGEFHARLLGPLVEWRRDANERGFGIRPLFYVTRSQTSEQSRGWLLYPLASWTSTPDETSVRFLGIGSYVSRAAPPLDRPYDRELSIFPLLFYRHDAERGTSFSLLPLYANLENFFGYDRVRMLAFPLFLRIEEPFWQRTWLPFPLLSWVGGASGEGVRVWPIYGRTRLGSTYESSYVGWPFDIHAVEHPGTAGEVRTRIAWPFFSAVDGPMIDSRSYGFLLFLPLYTRTIDRAAGSEIRGFPWPVWSEETDLKTGERKSIRLTPIYENRVTATQRQMFYGWPFYRRREGLGDDASYRRTDVLFVLYRDESEGEGERRARTVALLPFWISRQRGERENAQSLTLLDGVFPQNEALQRLWAPLYRIYGVSPDGERDVLWRMWTYGAGKLRPPWYFSREPRE